MLRQAEILVIGAGGIGGEVGEGLMRKGVGSVTLLDPDVVEPSNLNRQRYYESDLYCNKALALAKNLLAEATDDTIIIGRSISFEDAVKKGDGVDGDVIVCGVDNNLTRISVAQYFLQERPVVFIGVDELADHGYVFIQEVGGPCFACLFPHALLDDGGECAKVGAVKDILKVVGGLALYAIDSVLMERKRNWNFREVSLAGFVPEANCQILRSENCPVCGEVDMGAGQ